MELKLPFLLILTFVAAGFSYSAGLLDNPDFESPPSGLPPGSAEFVPLNRTTDSFPGWSFGGTVFYVRHGASHDIQLGPDGRVNQTFVAAGAAYLLTVNLAAVKLHGVGKDCRVGTG